MHLHRAHDAVGAFAVFVDSPGVFYEVVNDVGNLGPRFFIQFGGLSGKFHLKLGRQVNRDIRKIDDEIQRVLDLVGDAGSDRSEGGQLFLGDDLVLHGLQFREGGDEFLVLAAQFFGALGDAPFELAAVLFEFVVQPGVLE